MDLRKIKTSYETLCQAWKQMDRLSLEFRRHVNFVDLNRTGGFLKNKFYSKLRKGIRSLNFMIESFLSKEWKTFEFDIVFKLVSCTANKFDFSSKKALGKKI